LLLSSLFCIFISFICFSKSTHLWELFEIGKCPSVGKHFDKVIVSEFRKGDTRQLWCSQYVFVKNFLGDSSSK
jgi:hypothetical protein